MKQKALISILVACGILAASGFAYVQSSKGSKEAAKAPLPTEVSAKQDRSVLLGAVASVNGAVITEAEIRDMMQRGVDRSAAVDARITQMVMARAAAREFATEAEAAMNSAKTDILAGLYRAKKEMEIRSSLTDKEVSDFYEKNLSKDEFRKFKLKFVIAKDAADGQQIYSSLTSNKTSAESKAALERFQYLNKEGEHFQYAQEVPYGIGTVVRTMKPGELVQPLLVREGVLIVLVDEVKEGERPELKKVDADIRTALASQKLAEEIGKLRKEAKIELKS